MAFPSTLPTHDDFLANETLSTADHSTKHNDVFDELEAIEAKLGVDSSAVNTSIDYLLKSITGGHDHDGSDSKKVIATNLDVTGLTASQLLRLNAAANAIESSGKTVPSGDIVGTSDTQTLTNKTLTSPVFSAGAVGTADIATGAVTGTKLGKAEGCGCTLASAQTITTATNTQIIWDTELWDTNSLHSTVANQSRFTIQTAGLYQMNFQVIWSNNVTGTYRVIKIYKNGADVSPARWFGQAPNATAGVNSQAISACLNLAAADYIELTVIHDLGSNLNINTAWGEIYMIGKSS